MKIQNIDGLSASDLQDEVSKGGRFVYYPFTVSLVFFTLKRTSDTYLVRAGETAIGKRMFFTMISLLFGWWGIPFGPKYAFRSIVTNLRGGKEVTDEVMATVAGFVLFEETQRNKKKAISNIQ
jgi:hypothetical protein